MVKKTNQRKTKVDLGDIFLGLQDEMMAALRSSRKNLKHPTTKGNVSENSWRKLLSDYLPARYCVAEAFVVDSAGDISEQMDLVIFDRQYSPFLFSVEGACYIPAESVYAVFEVKQDATKKQIDYAAKKAESVRKLKRTSIAIPHAGGRFAPIKPKEIIAGFLALTGGKKFCSKKEFSGLLETLPLKKKTKIVKGARVTATVHITLSLPCVEEKRQNRRREILGNPSLTISRKPDGVGAASQ
jgi:hypothetical protein